MPFALRRWLGWGVHGYTAMGLPLALLQVWAMYEKNVHVLFAAQWFACFIDATDGALARGIRIREVVPEFDGRRLDDIVDFLTFAFLPALAVPALGLVPPSWAWVAVIPLLASGYGFCQEKAKTSESFVGFPSYWNIVILYLYVLKATHEITVAVLVILAILVFVPIHYIYPNKAKLLKPVTLGLGAVWACALIPVCFQPDASWAQLVTALSLFYPFYYLVVSLVHHFRVQHTDHADTQ